VYDRVTRQLSDTEEPGTGLAFDAPSTFRPFTTGLHSARTVPGFTSRLLRPRRIPSWATGPRTASAYTGERPRAVAGRRHPDHPGTDPVSEGVRLNNPSPTLRHIGDARPAERGEDLIYAALTLSDAAWSSAQDARGQEVLTCHVNPTTGHSRGIPYATALCPRGQTLYVSLHNGSAVAVWTSHPARFHSCSRAAAEFASAPAAIRALDATRMERRIRRGGNSDLVSVIDNDPSSPNYAGSLRAWTCACPKCGN